MSKLKLTNEEKEKNYKMRKILRIIIIILGFLTIIFAIDYLFQRRMISIILALISQIVEVILARYRDSLAFKEE